MLSQWFEQDKRYQLGTDSRITKADIDEDAGPEYVINAQNSENASASRKNVILILTTRNGIQLMTAYEPEMQDPGLPQHREIYVVDVNGDGRGDVVDQRVFDIGGEEPNYFALVLLNKPDGLVPVYSEDSFGRIALQDLDRDGRRELIETTNEFKIPYDVLYWPVVKRWRDGGFVAAEHDFPTFYRSKLDHYNKELSAAGQRNREFERKTGQPNPVELSVIKALQVYISRIRGLSRDTY